jgi:AMMECR1 domain-containing protein
VDGLLIRFGDQRATFLPKVWESLREPADFLGHLKRKMGQADDFWDASVIVERYQSEEFTGPLIP